MAGRGWVDVFDCHSDWGERLATLGVNRCTQDAKHLAMLRAALDNVPETH